MKNASFTGMQIQRGVSLVVVLILLLIMTLLGLAVLRSTLLEERMSANLYDRSLGFQSAEAVLREAESVMAVELTVTLSVEESRRFLKALDAPFQPNAKLKKALARVTQA